MASKDIVVTLGEDDWRTLSEAADAANMGVEAYVSWCARIFASQARPGGSKRTENLPRLPAERRTPEADDESDSAAWAETFSQRLSHRADRTSEG
ncbi:hypothetical protein [Nocardia jejuensis]|uniref:hypothetical protein n=1 Tax=Nocardia jejuensis TaxID=328049 RepID=UPI0008315275|nr:hypothetical protein [Nocardia jejuensis]